MNRPSFINETDYKILKNKYNDEELLDIINKIENDYPVQYAIGNVPFLNTTINVDERALIPRFETELLVDILIKKINEFGFEKINVLDICTGSGAIAIALKKAFKNSNVSALDISDEALELAKENAVINNVDISFTECDILSETILDKNINIIVSNPPYVKENEYVSPNTKYEPQNALYPGKDDIIFYKKIIDLVINNKLNNYLIAFEIGSTQADRIKDYVYSKLKNINIEILKDYAGFDRFIFIMNK